MDVNLIAINLFVGVLISAVCEQSAYFKDDTRSGLDKILIVLALSIVWAVALSLLSLNALPTGYIAWRDLIATAVVTGLGSQAFHKSVTSYFPSFGDFLIALRAGAGTVTSTATITSGSYTGAGTVTNYGLKPLNSTSTEVTTTETVPPEAKG